MGTRECNIFLDRLSLIFFALSKRKLRYDIRVIGVRYFSENKKPYCLS